MNQFVNRTEASARRHVAPQFLHQNPDICTNLKIYARANLDTLSIEMLSGYIHDIVLPNLIMDILNETVNGVRTRMANNKEEYKTS